MSRANCASLACLLVLFCWAVKGRTADSPDLPAALVLATQQGQVNTIDLTYPLDDQSPFWPEGSPRSPFHAETSATYARDGFFARSLQLPEHFGTHLDAPLHFDPQGQSVEQLSVKNFFLPAVVVDVSASLNSNPDYRLTVQDIQNWEKSHGPVPAGAAVLLRTGWGTRWPSQDRYINQDAKGVMHFPGFSLEAARYLLDHAHPKVFGIDTTSIDYGPSQNFEVHHLTLRAGLYHLENLANLELLPPTGAVLVALPMNLRGGSGAPARVVALIAAPPAGQP